MKPVRRTTPDEWAAENRVYPTSHGRPGKRDPTFTPYMVPFARAFDAAYQLATFGRHYEALVKVTSAQSGKTDTTLDVIGQTLDQAPGPILYVGPSREWFNQSKFEQRLSHMLATAPGLKAKASTGKRTNKWHKHVGGVPIGLAWAGSPSQLRGMSARIAIVDELDAMGVATQKEGDTFALLEARGASYRDRIRAAISTPLEGAVDTEVCERSGLEFWRKMEPEDVSSPIWRHWQSGTMHHFCWPCPHCAEFFVPRFKQLRWPEGATPAEAKRTAWIECPRCGGIIDESHKASLNARGVYVAPGQTVDHDGTVRGEPPDATTLSMWSSGLCSPMVTIGERAASYLTAKASGEQSKIQAVINTGFGECYAPGGGDVPEWQEVAECRQPYAMASVPDGVRYLTLTVDVQKRSLVYVIRGWGHAATSWLIDCGELGGETAEAKVWNDLALLLKRPLGDRVIHRAFIDSGYRPDKPVNLPVNRVYEFCRRFPRLAFPTKGRATSDRPVTLSKIEVTATGRTKSYGLDLYLLDTDWCKSWVHERIRWDEDQPGAWHLPEDISEGYCKQIVSEARVRKPDGRPVWVRRSRQNHYFDCEAMQAAIAHSLNLHLLSAPEPRADEPPKQSRQAASPPPARPAPAQQPAAAKPAAKPSTMPAATARDERRRRIADLAARLYGNR